jgi:hypothetical protein
VTADFPWYVQVEGMDLQQGDLLKDCAAPVHQNATSEQASQTPIDVDVWNVIVMTQSCDLVGNKATRVMLCPVWDAKAWLETFPSEQRKDKKNKVGSDQLLAYHVLNPCKLAGLECGHLVVDFANAFSIDRGYATELAGQNSPRGRLQPPYREYVAQGFARFFMRVGLPVKRDPIP